MSNEVDIWKWTKWMLGIVRAKYWLNLFFILLVSVFIWLCYNANTAVDCDSCDGFGWAMLAFFTGIINMAIFFSVSADETDSLFIAIVGLDCVVLSVFAVCFWICCI
jgi:hypothetical protein